MSAFDIDVRCRLGDATVGASFRVEGGISVMVGSSGAGKSSVLNMAAGLLKPDAGYVLCAGETLFDADSGINLPPERRRFGYVFQDGRLFPHRRVRANLLYGHRLAPAAQRWIMPEEVIDFLGIAPLLDRWPRALSGGEARRVAIGRALLSGARALLMDEPLSSLDPARREELMRVIERIRDEMRLPILYVTHDMREAERLASQIVEIERLG